MLFGRGCLQKSLGNHLSPEKGFIWFSHGQQLSWISLLWKEGGVHFRVIRIMGWETTPRGFFDKDHWWYRGIPVRISWSKRQGWQNSFLDSTDIFSESSTAFPFLGVWKEKIWLPEDSHFLCWGRASGRLTCHRKYLAMVNTADIMGT